MSETQHPHRGTITEGEFEGWSYWPGDPFEERAGPFYMTEDEHGPVCAFRAREDHLNGGKTVHGGCLMAFADFALFGIAGPILEGEGGVTVSFSAEFVGPARAGQRVEARGEVTGGGRSLLFVRGIAKADGTPCLAFSGTIKRFGPR